MKRTERLFALAEVLRGRRTGITAEALAERFGVTVRTIYRDLASLKAAALPLTAERGRGGGYALDRSYRLPPVNFTAREAAVLIRSAEHLLAMRQMPFPRTLTSGLDKLRAALSSSAQRELLERLPTIQPVGIPARPVPSHVRDAIEEAWFAGRLVRLAYGEAHGTESERLVRIRQLILDRAEVLLNVDQHTPKGVVPRQLKMHRIVRAEVVLGAD